MTALGAIEAEIVDIRLFARSFKLVDKTLVRNRRFATPAETEKLKAGIARFEVLVAAASRLQDLN